MRKILFTTYSVAMAVMISACGSYTNVTSSNNYTKNNFELDDTSVHLNSVMNEEYTEYTEPSTEADNSTDDTFNAEEVSELQIENIDKSQASYVESGDDILYLTQVYKGLALAERNLEHPYSKEQFLDFLTRIGYSAFGSTAKEITVTYDKPEATSDVEGEENTEIPLDDELTGSADYDALKTKFGVPVEWSLLFMSGDKYIQYFGCKDYMLVQGSSESITVNIEDYQNSGLPKVILADGTVISGDDYVNMANNQEAVENAIEEYNNADEENSNTDDEETETNSEEGEQ